MLERNESPYPATGKTANPFNGVKVFSATKAKERELLGEAITGWLRQNPNLCITDKIVSQSSDSEFHCLTITFFFYEKNGARH